MTPRPESKLEPTTPQVQRLLTVDQVRGYLTAGNRDYGVTFTDREWSAIVERLSALARLLWRINSRETGAAGVVSKDGLPSATSNTAR